MSPPPLVSVVTIFLNGGTFLDEAVRSVVAQRLASWELLLVDDGSTDESSAVARDWARRHPDRIRYLEHPGHANRGMSASRNAGIGEARGEFLAFLDADDVWVEEKLAEQVDLLRKHPDVVMVFGGTRYWYSWSGRLEDADRDTVKTPRLSDGLRLEPPVLLRPFLHGTVAVPGPGNIMVRLAAARAVGGFEEAFRSLYEDQAFYAKICLHGPILVSHRVWDWYRQHPESACSRADGTREPERARRRFLDWVDGYIDRSLHDEPRLHRAVAREIFLLDHPRVWTVARHAFRLARRLRLT